MISKESENLLDRMRVASPCPVSWDAMKGNDKKRFCEHCNLHVYNISSMTRREAEDLIKTTEGRLCARLYRRADGTVLTQDCPVGLKALRRRLKMRMGVFVSMLFGLSLTAFGQDEKSKEAKNNESLIKITRTVDSANAQITSGIVKGIVVDESGGFIPNVKVTIINERTRTILTTTTKDDGAFIFENLTAASYLINFQADGFRTLEITNIKINERELLSISSTLIVGEATLGIVGVQEISTPVNKDQLKSLPPSPRNALNLILSVVGNEATQSRESKNKRIIITRSVNSENAQNEFSRVEGIVFDKNDAVIPNAKVKLTNEETKLVVSLSTNEEGRFSIKELESGIYSLMIEADGFNPFFLMKIEIVQREVITVLVTLEVGNFEFMGELINVEFLNKDAKPINKEIIPEKAVKKPPKSKKP